MGSRAVPYTKTQDIDSQQSAGGQKQTVYFNSISAMPAYVSKSVEELRHEDYAVCRLLHHQRNALGAAHSALCSLISKQCGARLLLLHGPDAHALAGLL